MPYEVTKKDEESSRQRGPAQLPGIRLEEVQALHTYHLRMQHVYTETVSIKRC